MSPVFINGMGNISPQKSFDADSFLEDVVETKGSKLACLEPDYASWIDPKSAQPDFHITAAFGVLQLE